MRREYEIQEIYELLLADIRHELRLRDVPHGLQKKVLYWLSRTWDSGFNAGKTSPPGRTSGSMPVVKPR